MTSLSAIQFLVLVFETKSLFQKNLRPRTNDRKPRAKLWRNNL